MIAELRRRVRSLLKREPHLPLWRIAHRCGVPVWFVRDTIRSQYKPRPRR